MDIRIIVFGMCFVLIGLFIWAKFFVPHEKERSRKEALFVESMNSFLSSRTKENYQMCMEHAAQLPHLRKASEEAIREFLSKNQVTL